MRLPLFTLFVAASLQATPLQELLQKLKTAPITQTHNIETQLAKLYRQKTSDKFYPQINLFATYEHYTNDTNLRPLPPPKANSLIAQHEPLPFAQNIQRIGANFSMPLFVKSLFSLRKKAEHLLKAAKLKAKLQLLQNQAIIVGAYAQLIYLKELQKALQARKKALSKTKEDIAIKVKNGRAAPIAIDKIDNLLNSIDMALLNLQANRTKALSTIAALIGSKPKSVEPIKQITPLTTNTLFAIKPMQAALQADKKALQASKEQLLPRLLAEGSFTKSYAQDDVMFGKSLHLGYGYVGVKLVLPLVKSSFTGIEIAKAKLLQSNSQLSQKRFELLAKAKALQKELKLNSQAQKLARKQVKSQKNLLHYAKTAFSVGRMDEEEYLRYEAALLEAQMKLAQTKLQKWQILSQLAVIYGNDLERIVQ